MPLLKVLQQIGDETSLKVVQEIVDNNKYTTAVRSAAAQCEAMAATHLQAFAGCKVEFHKVATSVDEDESRSRQLFQNEPFAAEEPGTQLLHEGHAELNAGLGKQEGVALGHDTLSRSQFERMNAPGVTTGESDFTISV